MGRMRKGRSAFLILDEVFRSEKMMVAWIWRVRIISWV